MYEPLLEAVPNVSVARDAAVLDAIVDAVRHASTEGARKGGGMAELVDVHRDSDHDRSVLTILGRGEALARALEALARAAVAGIDLHAGHGVHPRVGALDVLPIVALDEGVEAQRAAHDLVGRLARFVGAELHVPVVRYGLEPSGAPIAGAANTGLVRRGGLAGVLERCANGNLQRIAGPAEAHPTAGVTICGVRDVLVAFNVDLNVDDLDLARTIAARIRASADGPDALPGVRALGLRLASRGIVQVSTNLDQPRTSGPAHVLDAVARLAAELGAGAAPVTAELVGLAPDAALAPLRYACTRHGVSLATGPNPSLDAAIARLS